ncbi:G-protein-signaling modulator 1 [Anabas testudineus]|uniref:G-protein-signaling modulator 1 n=1 Tax=Anabas testudineus TaxID=64144 RepID=UPI000E463FE4|nr:G-protein-signaling modulator 1 [Anabas testudineus]
MADKKLSALLPSSMSAPSHPSHLNGSIREAAPKCSSTSLQNGGLESGPEPHSPHDACSEPPAHSALSSRTPASISPLRTLRSLMNPESSSSSSRPRGQSLSSALTTRTRTTGTRRRRSSSQQEGPDALLDLILESQGQRLNDQRASLSLLPDPEPTALCGTCSPSQTPLPSLDFYYMLIHYQSDRMEDQRCPLPDLDDVVESVPEGQEDFFSLIQRVQSRRMNEQRAWLLINEDDDDARASSSSSSDHHHH